MARIPYVEPADASPPVREALEALPPLKIFRLLAHADDAFRPGLRLGAAILGQGELDAKLRELAILRVAALTGARYEWVQHAAIALAVGATDEQVAAIEQGDITAGCLDATEQLVLRFATDVIECHGATQETFDAAAAVFPPRQLVELTLSIGYYTLIAQVMNTFEIDLEPAVGTAVLDSAAFSEATEDDA